MKLPNKFATGTILFFSILSGCSDTPPSPDDEAATTEAIKHNSAPKMNVLILVLDSFRADMSSLYGYDKPTTPHLEAWAKKGTVFTNAYSQSTTTNTSVWSYFNGQYPYLSDLLNPIREEDTPLPVIMRNAGYTTAAFSDNPYISTKMGFSKGFDIFDNRLFKKTHAPFPKDNKDLKLRLEILAKIYPSTGDTSKDLIEEAQKWDPWFCYVHILRPHNPYYSPEPFFSQFLDVESTVPKDADPFRFLHLQETLSNIQDATTDISPTPETLKMLINLYEGSIAYSDHLTNEFLLALENNGILENTMVIIMSDHGEAFEDHGKLLHGRTYPYQEQVHVPLIILTPESFTSTVKTSDTPVSLVDLLPTLQDMLGLDVPQELHGQSLMPLMLGESTSFRNHTFFQNLSPASVGVMHNNQTLMTHLTPVSRHNEE